MEEELELYILEGWMTAGWRDGLQENKYRTVVLGGDICLKPQHSGG